jgi:hypothetical protein
VDDLDKRESTQEQVEAKTKAKAKVPKSEIWVGLATVVIIIAHDLCLLVLGYGSGYGEFVALPLLFLVGIFMVAVSVIMLARGLRRSRLRYSKVGVVMRALLLIAILLRVLYHPTVTRYMPLVGVRLKVQTTGGVGELQKWAIMILDMPIEEVVPEEDLARDFLRVKKELYSEQVRQIATMFAYIGESDDGEKYINFPLAGGFFNGWGIRVGKPGFREDTNGEALVQRWGDGVYGFSL